MKFFRGIIIQNKELGMLKFEQNRKKSGSFKLAFCRVFLALLMALLMAFSGCAEIQSPSTSVDAEVTNVVATAPQNTDFVAQESERVVLLACSDIQQDNNRDSNVTLAKRIMEAVKEAGFSSIDGFFCAGDYSRAGFDDLQKSTAGYQAISSLVEDMFGKDVQSAYVLGNHDPSSMVGGLLSPFGNNDTEDYGVFVIHEDDYMWFNDNAKRVKKTADHLRNYLAEKAEQEYSKPIFVVSHLPLHYSMRTLSGGGDGKYAAYLFDVLNEAGEAGLNIFFLYGHNHSHGWDNYLGGAAVYLAKGDAINIAKLGSTAEFVQETLTFTYMNAGYVGYYTDSNRDSDRTLTMSVFVIDKKANAVTISRFSRKGMHPLKAKGVSNAEYPDAEYYSPDERVIESGQLITLSDSISSISYASAEAQTPPAKGRYYTSVASEEELVSGKQYLLIYSDTADSLMLPQVISVGGSSGTRVGCALSAVDGAGKRYLAADHRTAEWTLTETAEGWVLSCEKGQLKLTATADKGVAVTLEEKGTPFVIGGSEGAFTFTGDGYVLNYNASRNLINGFSNNAAGFYLYKLSREK